MTGIRRNNAFTLVEILVVLGVIAVLAGMVIALTLRVENRSKESAVANAFAVLKTALREYYEDTGSFPQQPQRGSANAAMHIQLMYAALESVPASREVLKGVGGALVKDAGVQALVVTDPWGTVLDYVYAPGDSFPALISAGPDKRFGTADDISSKDR